MSETTPLPSGEPTPEAPKKPFTPTIEDKHFVDVLKDHLGKVFTIANSESFEKTGLGHEISASSYPARLVGVGRDYVIMMIEWKHGTGKKSTSEPLKQYIPISRIKRVGLMKSGRQLHI